KCGIRAAPVCCGRSPSGRRLRPFSPCVSCYHTSINPKSETRNPKQIQNPNSKTRGACAVSDFGILISCLFRISDFEFRIWRAIELLLTLLARPLLSPLLRSYYSRGNQAICRDGESGQAPRIAAQRPERRAARTTSPGT